MNQEVVKLNIKNFSDYRDFLKTHFEMKKTQNSNWSYGMWAHRLGLKATSSLTKIINGERGPGRDIMSKMSHFFEFDSNENRYFEDLIRLDKVKDDPRLKMMIMERMGREHPDARLHVMTDKTFEIISNWFALTIREMVSLDDFEEDAEWIQRRLMFDVSLDEIREAIKNLLNQGLLKRNTQGKLILSAGLLHTTNDVVSEAIKRFHEQMLDNAKISLREVSVERREFTGEVLTIKSSNLKEAKEYIREFKANFARMFEEREGDETYQFQIQLFPLTKKMH